MNKELIKEGYVAELNGKYLGKDFGVNLYKIDKAFIWKTKTDAKNSSSTYGFHVLQKYGVKSFNIIHVRIKTEIEVLD